jgi:hypothetical protein
MSPPNETPEESPVKAKISKFRTFMDWLSTARAFLLAATGFAVAIGAWLKPQDQVPIQATYNALKAQVEANSKATQDTHDDIMALRGYVEGKNSAAALLPTVPSAVPSSAPLALRPIRRVDVPSGPGPVVALTNPPVKPQPKIVGQQNQALMPLEVALPPVSSRPKSSALPPYAQVVDQARKAAE